MRPRTRRGKPWASEPRPPPMPGLEGVETVRDVPGAHRHGHARLLAVVLVPAFGEAGPHRQAVVQRRHHASVAGLQNARVVLGLPSCSRFCFGANPSARPSSASSARTQHLKAGWGKKHGKRRLAARAGLRQRNQVFELHAGHGRAARVGAPNSCQCIRQCIGLCADRTLHWLLPNPASPARTLQELPCKAHFPSFAGLDGPPAAQRWRDHRAALPEHANQPDGPVSGGLPVGRDCAQVCCSTAAAR